jgi:hypothetical protein
MPYDPATLPALHLRNYRLLFATLPGIQLSDAERASLRWLAGQELNPTVKNLTAVMARARSARPLGFAEPSAAEMRPLGVGYPG